MPIINTITPAYYREQKEGKVHHIRKWPRFVAITQEQYERIKDNDMANVRLKNRKKHLEFTFGTSSAIYRIIIRNTTHLLLEYLSSEDSFIQEIWSKETIKATEIPKMEFEPKGAQVYALIKVGDLVQVTEKLS